MPKKSTVPRARKAVVPPRVRTKRLVEAPQKWIHDVNVAPEELHELKNHDQAKKYIQRAMELSVKKRNKEMMLTALRNVATARENPRALHLITHSDGDFISVNAILLELGFFLQFNK